MNEIIEKEYAVSEDAIYEIREVQVMVDREISRTKWLRKETSYE